MAPISGESSQPKVKKWLKSILGVKGKRMNSEDNVCDAVPGPPSGARPHPSVVETNAREEDSTSNHDSIPDDAGQGSRREGSDDEHPKPKVEEPSSDTDEEKPNSQHTGNNKQGFPHNFRGMPSANQNNIFIQGTNVHIGPEATYNYILGYGNLNQQQGENKPEKSEAVSDMLKSNKQVEPGHLDLIAGHFDKQWRMIGVKLLFTEGELKRFKTQYEDRKEISYHMLDEWVNKRSATIGQLCRALWDTKYENAIKAVNDLSVKIDLI